MTNGSSSESYTFDAVGNRTASHRSASYSYQPFNRMTATANATMNFDANGNLVQKSEGSNYWRYGWDYENRMTFAATRRQTARYRYDALGRRVHRYFAGNKENTKFVYDGLDVVMDDDVNTGVTKYQNGLGIDDKLSLKNGGVTKYFLQDHLGSTVALTNSSGVATEQTNYDSFGNATSNLSTRYQYTGREYDSFSGFYYYRARWYDANLGRFVSEDPIGFAGGDVNLFSYVRNGPIKRRDPLGLDDADIAFRDTDGYRDLARRGNDFWRAIRNRPKQPECGPTGKPVLEWLVPDRAGGRFGPLGNKYNFTPPCVSHDSCYSTCRMPKQRCDDQLGADIMASCLEGGGTIKGCSSYAGAYRWGVTKYGAEAYRSAQEDSGCIACTLPTSPPPREPCARFGDWRCK